MTSTYTTNQGLEKPAAGDQSGTWGGTVNTNMDIIDRVVSGVGALTLTGSTTTLTTTDGTLTDGMYRVLVLGDSGDLGSNNTITISPNDQDKLYLVYNNLTANRSAIFSQGSGANATVENGETAWIYADGAGSGAAVRVATSSTKLLDQDGDTGIRVEEGGDDDDTIRFDIAGAEDFTIAANTLNVLSGSDLNINSGGTLTNAGTAYGFDNLPAFAGVLETNATFVDQAIFGPSVDGKSWNGKWTGNDSSGDLLFTSLMLVTIEDTGSDTQVNIWDLTEQSGGAPSTTSLGTVTITGAATPTSVAACMGYIICGSEDGISIIDPHSGSWAERTAGWPRSLSTSTTPALTDNDVQNVDAGLSDQPPFDPRTGGPLPDFACAYGTGADAFSLIKHDGNVWDLASTPSSDPLCIITSDGMVGGTRSGDLPEIAQLSISGINADDFGTWSNYTGAFTPETGWDEHGGLLVGGSSAFFQQMILRSKAGTDNSSQAQEVVYNHTNRTYTTGYMSGDIRGAWLANSKTADRSYKGNTLTEVGSMTEAAVESGAELMGYSGFSTSNYLMKADDADFDVGTGAFYLSLWMKTSGPSAEEALFTMYPDISDWWGIIMSSAGAVRMDTNDGVTPISTTGTTVTNNVWTKIDAVMGTDKWVNMYHNGVLVSRKDFTAVGSLSANPQQLNIGIYDQASGSPSGPATSTTMALVRLSMSPPTTTQIRQMYDAEKPMFVASAECLLQSGSTDAVLDVDVDPLTGKVLVTQTDAITIFDGLAVDKLFADAGKPTVNSGSSEKGKLWGALRAEQNSANAYVTAPAVDQRQVNEMVRGLASDLPKGVDLSKAKAWCSWTGSGTPAIVGSYNIKSITDNGTGDYTFTFGIPFKNTSYSAVGASRIASNYNFVCWRNQGYLRTSAQAYITTHAGAPIDDVGGTVLFFGELENE